MKRAQKDNRRREQEVGGAQQPRKKPYVRPVLRQLGSVRDVTLITAGK